MLMAASEWQQRGHSSRSERNLLTRFPGVWDDQPQKGPGVCAQQPSGAWGASDIEVQHQAD